MNYQELFYEVSGKKYGMYVEFEMIETKLDHLRKGKALCFNDLEIIGDDSFWPFSRFWMWPAEEKIVDQLAETSEWFVKLPDNQAHIINRLNIIFKNISLVSVVLRFVVPEYYAIYSRPPLNILNVRRGADDTQEYLNYLEALSSLQRSFGVSRLADMDMIVWAISEKRGKYLDEFKRVLGENLPASLTPEDLVACYFKDKLKIAHVYYDQHDYPTAGFWAAKAFEDFLYSECTKYRIFLPEASGKRAEMIRKLTNMTNKWGKLENQTLLRKTKEIRNMIIPGVKNIAAEKVKEFIDNIARLQRISSFERR